MVTTAALKDAGAPSSEAGAFAGSFETAAEWKDAGAPNSEAGAVKSRTNDPEVITGVSVADDGAGRVARDANESVTGVRVDDDGGGRVDDDETAGADDGDAAQIIGSAVSVAA